MAQLVMSAFGLGGRWPFGEMGWRRMPEHVQNRTIHVIISLATLGAMLAGGLAMYWTNQSANQQMLAKVDATLQAHAARLSALEVARQSTDVAAQADRLGVERRITQIETYYTQTLQSLNEIKQDVRALRSEPRKP